MNAFEQQALINDLVKQYKLSSIHGDLALEALKREVFKERETVSGKGIPARFEWNAFVLTIKSYVKRG